MKRRTGWLQHAAALLLLAACGGGDAYTAAPVPPVMPQPPARVVYYTIVSAGGTHTCGYTGGASVACWGGNASGQIANNTTSATTTLPFVTDLSDGIDGGWPASAGGHHTCALGVHRGGGPSVWNAVVHCWGDNSSGQLGDGTLTNSTAPRPVANAANGDVVDHSYVRAGGSHSCGFGHPPGALYCWGDNSSGQLGNGTTTNSTTPVAVLGGTAFPTSAPNAAIVSALTAGASHTCIVSTIGAAYCWGSNASGQLGNGTTTNGATPVPVAGGLAFPASGDWADKVLSAGTSHTCGVTVGGTAYCWGSNSDGQLGNGTTTDSALPVAVGGGISFRSISAGARHSCGVDTAGLVYCWGANASGQLGDGTTTIRPAPVSIIDGTGFTAASAGAKHSCGVTAGGVAYCWGDNSYGQLGDGATISSTVPVKVAHQP